jgi:DNA-binding LacI/PurR family transcriptional regulator
MASDKVTSLDVARLAGVSQSAVSRVFTEGTSVSKKTAEKVRLAAEQLGYRPNVLARSLITGKSRIIGLVVANLDNQFYPLALELLSKSLQARGYHILVFMASSSDDVAESVIQELLDYQVDGIITASVAMTNDLTGRCVAAGIPIVMFNRGQDDPRLSEVTSNNLLGGRAVADFLLSGGHRRVAHIAGWAGSSTGRDRARGFVERLAEAGIEPFAIIDGMYSREGAAEAARSLFKSAEKPDAIFVGGDYMAFSVMDVLRHELGLDVPGEVSVVGYDDVPMAAWPAYSLTTFRQPVEDMVEATVSTLLSLVEEGTDQPQKLRIEGSLTVRGSARKPKGQD